jgi:hypothetical protein
MTAITCFINRAVRQPAAHQRERNQIMKRFDNYEISPCRRYEEPDCPGKFFFEVCDPEEAHVWTLYGHIHGEGAQAIGDFATREHAEEVFQRITGIPFAGWRQVAAHLRLMHAAPRLLEVLRVLLRQIDEDIPTDGTTKHFASAYDDAQQVVLDIMATGRAA